VPPQKARAQLYLGFGFFLFLEVAARPLSSLAWPVHLSAAARPCPARLAWVWPVWTVGGHTERGRYISSLAYVVMIVSMLGLLLNIILNLFGGGGFFNYGLQVGQGGQTRFVHESYGLNNSAIRFADKW
jgi:hypothetical protein